MFQLDKMEEISSMCNSDSVTPLRNVSLGSSELTTKERLSICCKPSFQLRRLKNKGAILVLICSFFCATFFQFYWQIADHNGIEFLVCSSVFGLTLSIAGWIADIHIGRYRVISLSIWIVWAAIMLATVSSVLADTVDSYTSKIHCYVNGVLVTIGALGAGGFQANVIQFGMDQLHDASTSEITSFIIWYVWTYSSSSFIVYIIIGCLTKQYWKLVICICLSLALSSMLVFNHWLVKEPLTQNPFKLVYSVVRYAIKHKHPECRSAFTYCENEPPSRIDFGKSKYGGPFTTEQVEDVKTFLRFVILVFVASVIFSVIYASWQLQYRIFHTLADTSNSEGNSLLSKCFSNEVFINYLSSSGVIVLPLYEFFFYPLFHRCLEMVKSSWTFIFGILLLMGKITAVLVIEVVVRHSYLENTNYNSTIPCLDHGTLNTGVNIWWMAIPFLLDSLSLYVLSIRGLGFIVSQTPYSMRGLLMGTAYAMIILSVPVMTGISIPFTRQLSIWGTGIISCGFWYALLLLVVGVVTGFVLTALLKWYKKRKREDVLPNEHIFAERYYDRDN